MFRIIQLNKFHICRSMLSLSFKATKKIQEVFAGIWRLKVSYEQLLHLSMASTRLRIGIASHNLYRQNHLFMRILHISAKIFCLICEQNGNAKCLVTSFSESKEGGGGQGEGGALWDTYAHKGSANSSTL
jgi:hypothetical protein